MRHRCLKKQAMTQLHRHLLLEENALQNEKYAATMDEISQSSITNDVLDHKKKTMDDRSSILFYQSEQDTAQCSLQYLSIKQLFCSTHKQYIFSTEQQNTAQQMLFLHTNCWAATRDPEQEEHLYQHQIHSVKSPD